MDDSTLIIALACGTLVLGRLYGLWQRARVERSKALNTHSALTQPRQVEWAHGAAAHTPRK